MRPRRSLPVLGSSLLFVTVIALAGACGGGGAPPVEPVDEAPAEPLRAFHYELELQLTGLSALTDDPQVAAMGLPADIEIAAEVSGAVELPDREHSLTSVNLGFVSFDGLEAAHVGDSVWSRNPQTEWESGGAALGPFGALGVSPAALFGDALWQPDGAARAMLDAAPSEPVTVDGRAARRVELSGQALEAAFADAGLIQALLADPAGGESVSRSGCFRATARGASCCASLPPRIQLARRPTPTSSSPTTTPQISSSIPPPEALPGAHDSTDCADRWPDAEWPRARWHEASGAAGDAAMPRL